MTAQTPSPVLLVALDGAEWSQLRCWAERGRMPILKRLISESVWIPVSPLWPGIGLESWYSFVFASPPEEHGRFFDIKLWHAAEQTVADAEELAPGGGEPFYADWLRRGHQVAVVDLPFAPPPDALPGTIGIQGFQSFYPASLEAAPKALLDEVTARFADVRSPREPYGVLDDRRALELYEGMLRATRAVVQVAAHMVKRHGPDIAIIALAALHGPGHYLRRPDVLADQGVLSPACADLLRDALDGIAAELDRGLDRLLRAAGPDAPLFLFALDGMGDQNPFEEMSGEILSWCLGREEGPIRRLGRGDAALRFERLLPASVRRPLRRLFWRHARNWRRTPIFALPSPGPGAYRLNLQGRERHGVVSAGREAQTWLQRALDELVGLRELASDRPVVVKAALVDELVGAEAPGRATLPDLVVQWAEIPWWEVRGLRRRDGRELRFARAPLPRSRRTGGHRLQGFLLVPRRLLPQQLPRELDAVGLARFFARTIPQLTGRPEAARGLPYS